jgi:hypothetical protein
MPHALQIGPRGGKYYQTGSGKVYQGKYSADVHKKIGELKDPDEVTNAIFGIDKLVKQGFVHTTDVDKLYKVATDRIRQLKQQEEAGKLSRQRERQEIANNVREGRRETERKKKSYKERRIGKVRTRYKISINTPA